MSRIRANQITNKGANGAPTATNGLVVTGVCTATTFSGGFGSLSVTGDATITGNLGVGGTITYEDVARVDATGISTFREGFYVGPLTGIGATHYKDGSIRSSGIITATSFATENGNITLGDSGGATDDRILFGASSDLSIYHDGSNSFIDEAGTGDLLLTATAGSIQLKKNTGDKMLQANVDGSVELYHANTKELETKSGGVKLLGHSESIVTALTSASTVTIDFSLSNHFSCTMAHNITFANPTTESVGQSGTIVLTQDGTGSRTASWGSQFLWAGGTAPTLTTTAAGVDRIDYFVAAADKIHCVASLAMA